MILQNRAEINAYICNSNDIDTDADNENDDV